MMIPNADTSIRYPHRALLKIVVNRIVDSASSTIFDPTPLAAGGIETVEIGDQKCPARHKHACHLRDGFFDIGNIDQGQVAYNKVEGMAVKGQALGYPVKIRSVGIARACGFNQLTCRVDARYF